MELTAMAPVRRPDARKTPGRSLRAFDAVAWRPPSASRFDGRAANDAGGCVSAPTPKNTIPARPGWGTLVAGGVVAVLIGALIGGLLQI